MKYNFDSKYPFKFAHVDNNQLPSAHTCFNYVTINFKKIDDDDYLNYIFENIFNLDSIKKLSFKNTMGLRRKYLKYKKKYINLKKKMEIEI